MLQKLHLRTRREFIKGSTLAVLAAGMPAFSWAEKPRAAKARPVISGTLWYCTPREFRKLGAEGWRKELDEQQTAGFDLLWLSAADSVLENTEFALKDLLDLCAKKKMQVILDTGNTANWYGTLDLKKELEFCKENIRKLGRKFAGHPAFYAWYIPQEIYMWWDKGDRYIQELYPALAESCKAAAKLPVTLSPFFILDRTKVFGDFRFNEPDEYQDYWAKLIKRSGIDVIMLQDSGEHFSYVTNEQRRPFFEAMSRACRRGGARFWGNVEVAEMECPSIEEYVRRYGRVHHSVAKGIPWRPVPIPRLKEKLTLAAEYSERIVSWGYREFCRPALGPAAKSWYEGYREYYRGVPE